MDKITGWIEDMNGYGLRVGGRWVGWSEGGVARPVIGDYAEITLDPEGYTVGIEVRAWRPAPQNPN